ncbi:hypothetical protein MMC12_008455 [Toensbergia leucococca]|nr:hypothetical protein [Toensbergia leucococca]
MPSNNAKNVPPAHRNRQRPLPPHLPKNIPPLPPPNPTTPFLTTPKTRYALTLSSPSTLSPHDLTATFNLIATTSSAAYASSSLGWSPSKKRKEMLLPDLRYLLLKPIIIPAEDNTTTTTPTIATTPPAVVEAFMSFMLTYEDGREVIYCYEIHLAEHLQRKGVGTALMRLLEEVGRAVGVEKAMLTVFLANEGARGFYEGLGYGVDEFSPQPRRLRGRVATVPDYVILSKMLV